MEKEMSKPNSPGRSSVRSKPYELARLRKVALLSQGDSVLDIGYAQIPNPFLTARHRVGLDLERSQAGYTQYEEEIQGDVRDIATLLADRKFDTVICGELIEHLEDPYAFLRDVSRHIAPGGRLVITTPNPLSLPVILFEIVRSHRYFYTPDHRYYFAPRWVERLLNVTGYDLLAMKAVGWWLPFGVLGACPVALSYQVIYAATPRAT
jgi:2-polyprenyl-3-methyl-5-hydroxy-6-metoxy-1,4-benzoquinol methylase